MAAISSVDHSACPRLPIPHSESWRSWVSLLIHASTPTSAPHRALMAMPTSSRRESEASPARLRIKITTITAMLPTNAASIGAYSATSGGTDRGSTSQQATASAAPALIPTSPGSARGLRNSPCITQPESPSAAPTSSASSTRGKRMVSQMFLRISSPEGSRLANGRRMAPRVVASSVRTISSSVINHR